MQIFIRNLTGKTIGLEVQREDTILLVKKKFCDKEAIPAEYQVYIYAGKPLEDDKSLEYYGVTQESTINLIQRLPGGIF